MCHSIQSRLATLRHVEPVGCGGDIANLLEIHIMTARWSRMSGHIRVQVTFIP